MGNTGLFAHLTPLLLAALALLLVGLWLLKTGLWPHRRGETPHCRKCGYNLTALTSERCPECGSVVVGAGTVRGERRRSIARVVVCAVFLLLALLAGLRYAVLVVPSQWAPNALVLWDLKAHQSRSAADELESRRVAGRLTSAETQDYLEHLVAASLKVRPRVIAGDLVPFRCVARTCMPYGYAFEVSLHAAIGFDGGAAQAQPFDFCIHPLFVKDSVGGYRGLGRHRFDMELTVNVRSEVNSLAFPNVSHTYTVPLHAVFEVVPDTAENRVQLVRDPSVEAQLRPLIRTHDLNRDEHSSMMRGVIDIGPLPQNVAFDVYVRVAGVEYPLLGGITVAAGQPTQDYISDHIGGPPIASCDVILRSSAEVARNTVDLFEIWDGELVYPNVPVQLSPNDVAALQAAAATQATQSAAPTPGTAPSTLPLPPP